MKHVDETGFDYITSTEHGTTLSYLAVDPLIENIYMGCQICGIAGPEYSAAQSLAFQIFMDLHWREGLILIDWIKEIKFTAKPSFGWSYVCHHPPALPAIEMSGGIQYVLYNWFAFSPKAINIYGGEIRVDPRTEDPSELQTITVPKSVFRERPEIVIGISGLRYDGGCLRCDKPERETLPMTCHVSITPSNDDNDEAWIFDQKLEVCHADCFI